MSGCEILSEEEKLEMLLDAANIGRGEIFMAARMKSQEGSIDDYMEFLSENMAFIEFVPSKQITSNFKL